MRSAVIVLLLALVGCALAQQQWYYEVTFSDEGCTNWAQYEAKQAGSCVKVGSRYYKFDCTSFNETICTDAACTQCDPPESRNALRTCTLVSPSPRLYGRLSCGATANPFPQVAQAQRRGFNSDTCSGTFSSATGFTAGKCETAGGAGNAFRYSCNNGVITHADRCDLTCTTCASTTTISSTCSSGSVGVCEAAQVAPPVVPAPGSSSASGSFASLAFVVVAVLAAIL